MTIIDKLSIGDNMPARIMGIINTSPESFYKDSININVDSIANAAINMQNNGAHIIDVGAMSTAPYLETIISIEEETRRMKQAIEVIKNSCKLPISADTPRSKVAKEAIKCGVDAINDITGLKYDSNMANVISEADLPVIIGAHCNSKSLYTSGKISGTLKVLKDSIMIAKSAKIDDDNIIIDPSIGFFRSEGKNPFFTKMNDLPWYIRDIEIISNLKKLKSLSKPLCISLSRKSFIGNLFNLKIEERLIPSLIAEVLSVLNGANLIRTHSVKEAVQALITLELVG